MLTVITCIFALFAGSPALEKRASFENPHKGYPSRRSARSAVAEFAIFCLLFGVSACRIAVGNDYWPYRFNFRLIAQERHVSSELGFNLIVRGMQGLFGYDNYLPIFALFSFVTVLLFTLSLHRLSTDYALSLFLLLAGGYYFNSLNSVRYYLALAFAMFAFGYVLDGGYATGCGGYNVDAYVKFILWIFVAAMFHKSVLLVIPVYIAARLLSIKRLPWQAYSGLLLLAAAGLLSGRAFIREVVFKIYPYYRNSWQDSGRISYVNVLRTLMVFGLFFIYLLTEYVKQKGEHSWLADALGRLELGTRVYLWLNAFSLVALLAGSFIPESTRIAYYMMAFQIFLIPELLMLIKNNSRKIWLVCFVVTAAVYVIYFAFMLKGMYAVDVRLLPYLNWIFN